MKVYETAIKVGASISKAFKSDTYNAANALTRLTAATKQLKSAEKAADAFKKLDGELTRSKSRYDTATEALRKLEESERRAGGATKESTKWRKAGEREVAKAAREFDRNTKAAEKNAEFLRKAGVDTRHLADEQTRLARSLAATERQEKALTHYEAARERLFGKRKEKEPLFHKAGEQIKGLATDVALLGTATVGAGVGLFELVSKTAESGDQAAKMARRIGMGVEALQELHYAGARSGATIESVDTALGKMAINIGRLKAYHPHSSGGGGLAIPGMQGLPNLSSSSSGSTNALIDPFAYIHLSAKKLSKLKPEDQIGQIADAMNKLKTDSDRAAVAEAIFGRGGLALIPALKEGSAGIAKLRKEARETGNVLSEEATRQAEEFTDRLIDAKMAAAGVANTLGAALLPAVTDTFRQFSGWVKTNRVEIKAWIGNAVKWIESKGIPALFKIAHGVESLASKALYLVNAGAKLTGGFGNLAIAIAALKLAPLGWTLAKIAGNGLEATASLIKFAAASRAAALANGGSGIGAIAKLGIGGTAGALAIGGAVLGAGLYGIHKFAEAGEARNQAREDAGVAINKNQLVMRARNKASAIAIYERQGFSHGQAVYYAEHGGPPKMPRTGAASGAGGHISINAPITIGAGATKADATKAARDLERRMHEAIDKRNAHHGRVSFAR